MRVVISDHSGHPFQVQLSRSLARRGHNVLHVTAASFQTPKGRLDNSPEDPPTFHSVGVSTREPFAKSSYLKRRRQEIEMGRTIGGQIEEFQPHVVISSNAPLDAQLYIQRSARRSNASFVFWVQDLYGEAISKILSARFGIFGRIIGHYYNRFEARLIRGSDQVVVISDDFVPIIQRLIGRTHDNIHVIENWAPLGEVPIQDRDNEWARASLSPARLRIVYSGTIGLKHNPGLLASLAEDVAGDVVVFSEGPAADRLRAQAESKGLANLQVRGWLPFEALPSALAAADILVVLLEADAGIFSVPSKVLTYMCAGRPILGAVPPANLAARLIRDNGCGIVVAPDDALGFVEAAKRLAADQPGRDAMGRAARAYAERTFDIERITDRFESVIERATAER